MPFPESTRVIYKRNPLVEVICQVTFPPILKIEAAPPAEFQERVRKVFPIYAEVQPDAPPANVPPEFAKMAKAMFPMKFRPMGHQFSTEDEICSMTLRRDALGLKTLDYKTWDLFRPHVESLLTNLIDVYKPAFFSRVGLRYINVIQRSSLGLKDQPWADLLKPHIAGELAAAELKDRVDIAQREIRVLLDKGKFVTIRHGLVALEEDSAEPCFLIDSDFYTENRLEPTNAFATLDGFNGQSGHLFRWCIKDALHKAMEPAVANR